MAIIRWKPFRELNHLLQDVAWHDSLHMMRDFAIDVSENEKTIFVDMHVPGVDPDKIDIEVKENHLHVSGSREESYETKDRNYFVSEIKHGDFERIIPLPCSVKVQEAKASFENGVLKIELPKAEYVKNNKIHVQKK